MTNHPKLAVALWLIALVSMMISGILFVVFGQVTVRKLRKNPATRDLLGIQFVSGWDIANAARALSFPRAFARRADRGPLAALHANSEALYSHTTPLDRFLARAHFWSLSFAGLWILAGVLLDRWG